MDILQYVVLSSIPIGVSVLTIQHSRSEDLGMGIRAFTAVRLGYTHPSLAEDPQVCTLLVYVGVERIHFLHSIAIAFSGWLVSMATTGNN